jgi:thiol-disulfide isomerase/thioredoxin
VEETFTGNLTDNRPAGRTAVGKRKKLRFLIPLVLVLAVAAIACTSSAGSSSGSGETAPNFAMSMFQGQDVVGGQEVSLHDLIGKKPIVLNFWAGLCPPCRAEMPDLQEFNEKFEDRALLLGIDLGQFTGLGSAEDAQELLDELGVTYPAGFTTEGGVIQDYEVLGMPTTIFIDAQGKIFNKWIGALNGSVLEEKTLEMLNQ